jgi:hypothetical protein
MITARITPLKETPIPAAVTAIPGDWPGPTLNDLPNLAEFAVAW